MWGIWSMHVLHKCLSSTAHSQNPDLLPHHWECMETSSAASAASTAHLQLTNMYIYLSPIFFNNIYQYVPTYGTALRTWWNHVIQKIIALKVCHCKFGTAQTLMYILGKSKYKRNKKRKRKRKGGTPYVFRHTAA